MNVMEVKNLCKSYPSFKLNNISFSLEKGKIIGFIGKNGSGKTTTLKSIFNLVHPEKGEIVFFGKDFLGHELEIRQRVGFVLGGIDYYSKKKIKVITKVTKSFYKQWDNNEYCKYIKMFSIDENKTPSQLSSGMKVKYALALALSHNAELLILDEPTSGLDPVSRDELIDIFMDLCDKGITILFSTHITSDLDKCADDIIYIKNGEIIAQSNIKSFINKYKIIEIFKEQLSPHLKENAVGISRTKEGYSLLLNSDQAINIESKNIDVNLEKIMLHIEKEK